MEVTSSKRESLGIDPSTRNSGGLKDLFGEPTRSRKCLGQRNERTKRKQRSGPKVTRKEVTDKICRRMDYKGNIREEKDKQNIERRKRV